MTTKHELRSSMRALRKRLAEVDSEAAERAAAHAEALPTGEIVALYRAMGSELDTDVLAMALHQAGRRLCLPVVIERDAAMIFRAWAPGEHTGTFRLGGDVLLADEAGNSEISGADLAHAFVDEIERPAHRRARFTVAY